MDIVHVISLFGGIVTIVGIGLFIYTKWRHRFWKQFGIPGPDPLPFLGIMKSYKEKGICGTDLYLTMRYGAVIGIYHCHHPVLLVSEPRLIKEIFVKQFSNFMNRPIPFKLEKKSLQGVAVASDDHWKFLRRTISPTFTPSNLKLMVPNINKCCHALVNNIEMQRKNSSTVDMKRLCGAYTMDVICSTAFGIEVDSQRDPNNKFVKYAKEAAVRNIGGPMVLFFMMFPFLSNFFNVRLAKKEVSEFFTAAVRSAVDLRQKTKEEYQDFLHLMMNSRMKDVNNNRGSKSNFNRGLNQLELEANARTFFIAGYDTTANTLSFACYCLATSPEVQDKVIKEIDAVLGTNIPTYERLSELRYLDRFYNEVLRLYGAAIRFSRVCQEDITINDLFIPKGVDVIVPIYALHRNPKYWPNPEKFDPDRFTEENKSKRPDCTFLPFGIGPRNCLGIRLALLEAKIAIIYMLQNFKFTVHEKTEVQVALETGGILRAKNGIILQVYRRNRDV